MLFQFFSRGGWSGGKILGKNECSATCDKYFASEGMDSVSYLESRLGSRYLGVERVM